MKITIKKSISFIAAVALMAISLDGCQKGDGSLDYGYPYVYMPQAMFSGSSDLRYAVPKGLDSATFDFRIDSVTHKLNVILGVSRSGKQDAGGYSVNVAVDKDTTNLLHAANAIVNGVLLPDNIYTIPSSVVVPAGKNDGTFYLTVDANELKAPALTGKKAVICVAISNPSNYMLNARLSKTIVIIDVNTIRTYLK